MSILKENSGDYRVFEGGEHYGALHYKPLRLKQLARECWNIKVVGISLVLLFAAGGVVGGFILPPTYRATVVMSPGSETTAPIGGGTVNSLVSQFQGLASLAGVGGAGDARRSESIAVLQSESLTDSFISKYNLLPVLFGSQRDRYRKTRKVGLSDPPPDLWMGYTFFNKSVRTVATDTRTGLITLTIAWRDPHIAAAWANDLVRMANQYLQQKAIVEADRNIAYLNQQAEHTGLVEERQAISYVLQSEITKAMLARGNEEYGFRVLDPAFASDKPSSHGPAAWGVVGVLVGLLFWFVLVLLRLAWEAP